MFLYIGANLEFCRGNPAIFLQFALGNGKMARDTLLCPVVTQHALPFQ